MILFGSFELILKLKLCRAVVEAAAGHKSVLRSMQTSVSTMAIHPTQLVLTRPFGLMMLLYGATFMTANAFDTLSGNAQTIDEASTTTASVKLAAVCSVNVGLSVYKDSQFARMFGRSSARALPAAAYVPLVLRDGLTLFATFNLPQLIAPSLPPSMDEAINRLTLAQLVSPAAMQIFATPLHLLGLDLYNRIGQVPWQDRMRRVGSTCFQTTVARMCRIIPAYGLGGVVNTNVRNRLIGHPG